MKHLMLFISLSVHTQYKHYEEATDGSTKWLLCILQVRSYFYITGLGLWCLNAIFNNISVISLLPVLLVEETREPRENHWSVTIH